MTLQGALLFMLEKLQEGFKSDGCTYAPELGLTRFCVMHDVLLHYKPISTRDADRLFFKGIMTKGWHYFPVACIYWSFVRMAAMFKYHYTPMVMIGLFIGLITTIVLTS